MQKIAPFLWFDGQAEEAANFYVSVFPNSKVKGVSRYGEEGSKFSGVAMGKVMTVNLEIEGQEFVALNGGPMFTFSPAISFLVNCENQTEIDRLWDKLSASKKDEQCGWLKDQFGVSWQIVPKVLGEMMQDKDPRKSERVMKALIQMKKLDIEALKKAYEGK